MAVNAVSNNIHSSGICPHTGSIISMPLKLPWNLLVQLFSRFPLYSDGTTWKSSSLVPRPPPFLPFVCVHNNTWERKTDVLIFVDLPIPCIIVNANGRSKRGRPGTEAKKALYAIYQVVPAVLSPWPHQSQYILLQAGLRLVSSPLERRKLTTVSKSQKISWMKRYVNTCIQCSMEWV